MENSIESTLDDALNTFVQENDRPTAENVQEWVDRYPQFRKDLVEFAAVWAEQLVLPAADETGTEAEKVLVDRAISHVLNVAYNRDVETLEQTTSDDPVRGLTQDAQRAGTKPAQLAKACGLDLSLLSKLNNRQIQPWTIPAVLIGMLAEKLDKTIAALKFFSPDRLGQPPGRPTFPEANRPVWLSRALPKRCGSRPCPTRKRHAGSTKGPSSRSESWKALIRFGRWRGAGIARPAPRRAARRPRRTC